MYPLFSSAFSLVTPAPSFSQDNFGRATTLSFVGTRDLFMRLRKVHYFENGASISNFPPPDLVSEYPQAPLVVADLFGYKFGPIAERRSSASARQTDHLCQKA